MHDLTRTVAAVATPPGRGGIGCIRLSGPDAGAIARGLFVPAGGRPPAPGAAPTFGRFVGPDGTAVDHGFLVLFDPGSAFTGEPTAELWTHGSPAVLRALLEAVLASGAAAAGPGEFTYRAVRHGRIDLARAEAIRDLIAARTLYQARTAFARVEGSLSRRIAPLRESLAEILARGEAAVEFVEDEETGLSRNVLEDALETARRGVGALLRGFRVGRLLRDGATVAIVGAPNAGKSSLFNRLLERDRAIVSTVAGTTRDTLEESIDLEGIPVRLVDTAGLRDVADPLESEGVRRAHAARAEADLEILVVDGSQPRGLEATPPPGRTVIVVNKCDLPPGATPRPLPASWPRVSAVTGEGIDVLRRELRLRLAGGPVPDDPIVVDARHAEALRRAEAAVDRAHATSKAGLSEEAILEDVRDALSHLGEITGESADAGLYDRIFETFCIGK